VALRGALGAWSSGAGEGLVYPGPVRRNLHVATERQITSTHDQRFHDKQARPGPCTQDQVGEEIGLAWAAQEMSLCIYYVDKG